MARRAAEYPNLVVNVSHKGRYYHEYSMEFDANWWDEGDRDVPDMGRDGDVPEMLRDMAIALYRRLCEDYEYSQSDECVDDNIRANEYTFTVDGARFG